MIDFLNSFKSLVKLEQIRTDNNVFRLHYKLTVIMLVVFSILLTSKQYFGVPIQCFAKSDRDLIETYCWIFGTYILKNTRGRMPGMGPHRYGKVHEEPIIWQKYYQWVCIVFSFQALLFYLPRYLWKTWEGGRLRLLVAELNGPVVTSNWNNASKTQLIQYLIDGKYLHNIYAFRYTLCEILNLINVILQIFIMDWFLTGQFSFYGLSVVTSPEAEDTMSVVFPKMTKCMFSKYGPSGSEEQIDALCILPLNILNEKLFLVLWFWLFLLTIITFLSILYRICVMSSTKLRTYLLMAQTRCFSYKKASAIVQKMSYGDFFVLYHVGKNVNPMIFKELVVGLQDALRGKGPLRG